MIVRLKLIKHILLFLFNNNHSNNTGTGSNSGSCQLALFTNWWSCCGQIGVEWEKVMEKICRGRYQPLLLLYQQEHPSSIDTHTAPKQTFMVQNFVPHVTVSENSGEWHVFFSSVLNVK